MMRHTSLSNEIPALYHNIAKAIGFIDEWSWSSLLILLLSLLSLTLLLLLLLTRRMMGGLWCGLIVSDHGCARGQLRGHSQASICLEYIYIYNLQRSADFLKAQEIYKIRQRSKNTHTSDCFWRRVWFLLGFPSVTEPQHVPHIFFCATRARDPNCSLSSLVGEPDYMPGIINRTINGINSPPLSSAGCPIFWGTFLNLFSSNLQVGYRGQYGTVSKWTYMDELMLLLLNQQCCCWWWWRQWWWRRWWPWWWCWWWLLAWYYWQSFGEIFLDSAFHWARTKHPQHLAHHWARAKHHQHIAQETRM